MTPASALTISTRPSLAESFPDAFTAAGFTVTVNAPYKGCIIPGKHYDKTKKVSGIMIELNRSLYMGETTDDKKLWFTNLCRTVRVALGTSRATAARPGLSTNKHLDWIGRKCC